MTKQDIPDGCPDLVRLLLDAVTGGDVQVWTRCVKALEPAMRRYFHRACHFRPAEAHTVDDLVQEVLTQLVTKSDLVAEGLRTRGIGYFWQLVRNQYINWLRRAKRMPEAGQLEETISDKACHDVAEAVARREYGVWLAGNIVEVLTPEELEIVHLKLFCELTSREVGEILGRTCAAVNGTYDRALKRVRCWAEENGIKPEAIADAIVELVRRLSGEE